MKLDSFLRDVDSRLSLILITISALLLLIFQRDVTAAMNDWAEGSLESADGATRKYYNRSANLEWKNYLGDWADARDVPQGLTPYAVAEIEDTNIPRFIEWNVTELVKSWVDGSISNQGFFLYPVSGIGPVEFHSREYTEADKHPQVVVTVEGEEILLRPEADTYLEDSTYRSLGDSEKLRVKVAGSNILLRFNFDQLLDRPPITSAILKLFSYAQYGNVTTPVAVFRCAQGDTASQHPPLYGLAAKYPDDKKIEQDPEVIFATGFESKTWQNEWSQAHGTIETLASDDTKRFAPLLGKALRAKIPKGENSSMSTVYRFQEKLGYEPEEIYFRYYLRLGNDWNQTVAGGKLPGISGTYGRAGWGGRKPDGTDGWSARGAFFLSVGESNPLSGTHPIGTYCYYADQPGTYGDIWAWTQKYGGFLRKNRWYCIEQYLRMNTPGKHNGIIKAWVDGIPAFEKTDIMFRTVDGLKIEQIWMNVYHGGKAVSPYDQHLYVDNVVIARSYIGPLRPARSSYPWNLMLLHQKE